jgi:hypothetical protein
MVSCIPGGAGPAAATVNLDGTTCRRRSRINSRAQSDEERGENLAQWDSPDSSKKCAQPVAWSSVMKGRASVPRKLDFSEHRVKRMGSQMVGLTARAAVAASVFVFVEKLLQAFGGDSLHSAISYELPVALVILSAVAFFWALQRSRSRSPFARPDATAPLRVAHAKASTKATTAPDHPYYAVIDHARKRFAKTCADADVVSDVSSEREERLRAKHRSHDPRRWRLSPSYAPNPAQHSAAAHLSAHAPRRAPPPRTRRRATERSARLPRALPASAP